jgi:N-acyl-phosphatidylethanolamine-hydrolysing phospholipase D
VRRRYSNPWPGSVERGLADVLRWMAERRRSPPPPDPPLSAFSSATPAFTRPRAGERALGATWVGHAATLLQLGALNVLTDPVWGERASPFRFVGPRRRVPPGIAFDDLPPIDLILVSHDHYDHLDRPTVRRLARRFPDARWAAPAGVGRWLRRAGAAAVSEHVWWDSERADDLTVSCVPARHFSGRTPWGRNRTLWCGWVVRAGGRAVFFAGDTAWHPEFAEIAHRFGPFDLALLPIGAYAPRWMMEPVHMEPEEAVQAYRQLVETHEALGHPPPSMLPIHWGTFRLTDEPLDEPPRRLAEAWRSAGLAPERLWLLRPGETRTLQE